MKKKIRVGWVHNTDIYSYDKWGNEYISTGTTIYRKKRFDTPHKIKVTIERIK